MYRCSPFLPASLPLCLSAPLSLYACLSLRVTLCVAYTMAEAGTRDEEGGGWLRACTNARLAESWSLAIVSTAIALAGIGGAYWYYFVKVDGLAKQTGQHLTELPNGFVTTNKLARTGHKVLVEKYYLDHLYTGVIAGFTKGPLARATYWVNQNIIDGFINTTGETAVKVGRGVYDKIDQGVIEGVVNGSGKVSDATGEELRHINTGKVQNYAAILFAGAAVLAGAFIIALAL